MIKSQLAVLYFVAERQVLRGLNERTLLCDYLVVGT